MERTIEVQKDVLMCFVDFEKAFDTVRHEDMIDMLKEIRIDSKDISLWPKVYWEKKNSKNRK